MVPLGQFEIGGADGGCGGVPGHSKRFVRIVQPTRLPSLEPKRADVKFDARKPCAAHIARQSSEDTRLGNYPDVVRCAGNCHGQVEQPGMGNNRRSREPIQTNTTKSNPLLAIVLSSHGLVERYDYIRPSARSARESFVRTSKIGVSRPRSAPWFKSSPAFARRR